MEKKKIDLPFTGVASFCKAPVCTDWSKLDADVAVIGAPCDMSTQVRPGTRYGPRGIREASTMYSLGPDGYYDHEIDEYRMKGIKIVDCGDVDMSHMDPHLCLKNIYEDILELSSKDSLLVVMGGDHAITVPVVRALKDKGPFHLIQFDSHLDFVDEKFGIREAQNNPIRRISEMNHISGITQIGINGVSSSKREDFEAARSFGATIIGTREFRRLGVENAVAKIPEGKRFYVTFDVDSLNAAIAPGTGVPAPGGMDYYEAIDTLRGIAKHGNVIGFDFVEVAPMYDPTGLTCQVAADIMVDFIGSIFIERKKNHCCPK